MAPTAYRKGILRRGAVDRAEMGISATEAVDLLWREPR